MAVGTELFLGFRGSEKIDELSKFIDLDIHWDDSFVEIDITDKMAEIHKKLKQAWLDAIVEMGLEIVRNADDGRPGSDRYFIVKTPTGLHRKMVCWGLQVTYDTHEMCDDASDAILGISLISRYFPTFLDWSEDHGGSGNVITLDQQSLVAIQIARKHIETVLPWFTKADIHVKEVFY